MSFAAIVSCIVGLLAIATYVIKLSVDYSKLKSTVQHLLERAHEDRQKNSEKFSELYARKDEMRETLTELTASVESMSRLCEARFASLEKQYSQLSDQVRQLSNQIAELKYTRAPRRKSNEQD